MGDYDQDDYSDYEDLSSADYSYLYYQDYYEELVPVHHRFNQVGRLSSRLREKSDPSGSPQRSTNGVSYARPLLESKDPMEQCHTLDPARSPPIP